MGVGIILLVFGFLMVFGLLQLPGLGLLSAFAGAILAGVGAGLLWGAGPALIVGGYNAGYLFSLLEDTAKHYPVAAPFIAHNAKAMMVGKMLAFLVVIAGIVVWVVAAIASWRDGKRELVAAYVGMYLGGLLLTFFLMSLFIAILSRKVDGTTAAVISGVLISLIGAINSGFCHSVVSYGPCVAFWFWVDHRRRRKGLNGLPGWWASLLPRR